MFFRLCIIIAIAILAAGFAAVEYWIDPKWFTFIIPAALIIGIIGASFDNPEDRS